MKLLFRLTPEKHKDFKVACAKEGKSMCEIINKLIDDYLKKKAAA